LPGPCPSPSFPIQLCTTSAECFMQGDTCGPLTTPVAVSGITVCNASSGGGAASGSPPLSPSPWGAVPLGPDPKLWVHSPLCRT
jgi:hypothetical protein